MAEVAIQVTFDATDIRFVLGTSDGAAVEAVRRASNRVLNEAVRRCPVDEGRLRASLTAEVVLIGGEPVGRVGSNLPYARFVHDGTGIYGPSGDVIRPRNGVVLAWPAKNNSGSGNRRYSGGQTASYAFARFVRGVPGRPFLLEALRAAR